MSLQPFVPYFSSTDAYFLGKKPIFMVKKVLIRPDSQAGKIGMKNAL